MATRQRPADRGAEVARNALVALARDFQHARRDRGLSLRAVGAAVGVAPATAWRFERVLTPNISLRLVGRLLAVVGLDLSARAYPGPNVLRDEAHTVLSGRFRAMLHASLLWGSEVAFPNHGDQ